jgi:hypothetical protein
MANREWRIASSEWSALHRSIFCRHHPRKRVNQYAVTFRFITSALEYWVARSSLVKPGDDGCA